MKKIIEIYIKEREFSHCMTDDEINIKKEYNTTMLYIIKNLHHSRAISWVIRDLIRWQDEIIRSLAGDMVEEIE